MSRKNGSLRVPLLFDPGTGWEYGIGIDLAGKVVETVTGQSIEAYFRQHIFEPLGMRDTSFLLSDDMARRLVGTHIRGADGKPAPISFESPQDGDFYPGGAGLFSTAPDYLAFTRMLLAGGTLDGVRVLKQETVKLMAATPSAILTSRWCEATTPHWRWKSRRSRARSRNGVDLPYQHEGRRRLSRSWKPDVGRNPQHLFLDRP